MFVFRTYSDWSETDPVEGCDGKLVWETKTGPYKESWSCFPLLFTVLHSQALHIWRGRDDPSKSTYLHICSNAGPFVQAWQAHGQCGCWMWTSEHLHPLFHINKFPHLAKSPSFGPTQLIFRGVVMSHTLSSSKKPSLISSTASRQMSAIQCYSHQINQVNVQPITIFRYLVSFIWDLKALHYL